VDHLLHLYGAQAAKILGYREEIPNALERIAPGAPDLRAQVYHAIREEWAVTAEDIIYRRTTLGLRGLDTPEVRDAICAVIESEAGVQTPPPGLLEQPK
jgi:glycerol-3-phosphate dehydrogenase